MKRFDALSDYLIVIYKAKDISGGFPTVWVDIVETEMLTSPSGAVATQEKIALSPRVMYWFSGFFSTPTSEGMGLSERERGGSALFHLQLLTEVAVRSVYRSGALVSVRGHN